MKRKKRRFLIGVLIVLALIVGAVIAAYEMIASPFQAMLLAGYGKRLTFQIEAGEAAAPRVPKYGPYNLRTGYARLPEFVRKLKGQDFEVTAQARGRGVTVPAVDGLIAATARRHGLYLMTRNVADFAATGAPVLNPWQE